MNKKYKAIIFDMDGTVLDTLDELTHSLGVIFDKHQLPKLEAKRVRDCLGYGYTGLIDRAAPDADPRLKAKLVDEFRTYYGAHCQGNTFPYPGICDLLKALRDAGYKTCIVSNKGQAAVTELHDECFKNLVDFSLGETPEYRKKPAPDMVWEALKRLGTAKEDAVYIGDSEVDRLTAQNAGLASVLVTWGFRDESYLKTLGADHLVHSVDELGKLFL